MTRRPRAVPRARVRGCRRGRRRLRRLALVATLPVLTAGAIDLSEVPVHRSGTDFELRFVLREAAFPFVVHLDPLGALAVVHPDVALDELPGARAGETVTVPDPDAGLAWSLSGAPGYETFVLVAARTPEVDLVAVRAEVAAALHAEIRSGVGRVELVETLEKSLQVAAGPTQSATILHVP